MDIEIPEIKAHLIGRWLGNYQLCKQLGSGGFATVYLGKHRYLGTWAAIKVLHARPVGQEIKPFMSEAQTAAQLTHPHIIRVLDFAVHGRIPYLVMEYAPNHTLRNRHPAGSQLSPARVILYVQQVASALQYIHDRGFIHRDVKPGNMLIGEDQRILLSDFGISVAVHGTKTASQQEAIGTVAYMAPEQIKGKPCVASDQYALGVVVYEWLTGRLPFEGSQDDTVDGHLYDTPPSLRSSVARLPLAVEHVVLKALAKAPEERFGSVQEFAEVLERAFSQPSTQTSRSQVKHSRKRKQPSLLREAAGLFAVGCFIGIALGITLSIVGFVLEGFWLLFMLLLVASPLLVALYTRNYVALMFASYVIVISTFFGVASHSALVFLLVYVISSFINMVVTFSLGIQDKHPGKRP